MISDEIIYHILSPSKHEIRYSISSLILLHVIWSIKHRLKTWDELMSYWWAKISGLQYDVALQIHRIG